MNRNPAPDNLNRLSDGRLDDLSPEAVAELESLLNSDAGLAAGLAAQRPAPAWREDDAAIAPTPAEWAGAWDSIQRGAGATAATVVEKPHKPVRLWLRITPLLTATAAAVALAISWPSAWSGESSDWRIALDDHVSIDEIETFGDVTSMIEYAPDGGAEVVWLLQDAGMEP